MLDFDKYTFIFVAINLLILFFMMKKMLFKPVSEFMAKRTQSIKDDIDNAKKSKAEAIELKKKYEEDLMTAKQTADKIIDEARNRANSEYEAIVGSARQNAETLLENAKEEIEREREEMVKGIKNQVASLALSAASKIIEANMDTESNRKLVNKFIDEVGAA